MKVPAAETELVPPGVVTVRLTVPADPAGEMTVREVAETKTVPVPGVVPNLTTASEVNAVPETVTVVPPASGPAAGLTPVTVGAP